MPLERARMRMRITLPVREAKKVRDKIVSLLASVEKEEWTPQLEIVSSIIALYQEVITTCLFWL